VASSHFCFLFGRPLHGPVSHWGRCKAHALMDASPTAALWALTPQLCTSSSSHSCGSMNSYTTCHLPWHPPSSRLCNTSITNPCGFASKSRSSVSTLPTLPVTLIQAVIMLTHPAWIAFPECCLLLLELDMVPNC
jgi:hypothetical protein